MRAQVRLWRRLDGSGHDTCRLDRLADGWQLSGTAVFLHDGQPACLTYTVLADAAWHTREGQVRGWAGRHQVELLLVRRDQHWSLNGRPVAGLADAIDLDLAFTPATNLLPLRRLEVPVGTAVDAPAAWLDTASWSLRRLQQRYEHRSPHAYWYSAPEVGYAELLEVDDEGFVRRYPHQWELAG
jgi:uncharacterized protein